MYKVRNISSPHHVMNRAGIYYYVRRIPADFRHVCVVGVLHRQVWESGNQLE